MLGLLEKHTHCLRGAVGLEVFTYGDEVADPEIAALIDKLRPLFARAIWIFHIV